MTPEKRNITLQESFVRTELEDGQKALASACRHRELRQDDTALESLRLARVALSGAERHLAAVILPRSAAKHLFQGIRDLRIQIERFEDSVVRRAISGGAGA